MVVRLVQVRLQKCSRTNLKYPIVSFANVETLGIHKKVPLLAGGALLTGIAQLVEHRSPKPRVVGSSPPSRAKKEE